MSQPLDFGGLSDNRLAIESQRGFSWTDTQYKLQGIDATDSYQPGLPPILPEVQALDEIVVRSAFAQTASSSDGTEVGLFLGEPRASWHSALSTANTGAVLSSTNLPLPATRGIVCSLCHKRTPLHAQQVVFAHHPQHQFAIDREASVSQLGGDSSIPVGRRFHRDLLHLIADLHLDRGSLPWRS